MVECVPSATAASHMATNGARTISGGTRRSAMPGPACGHGSSCKGPAAPVPPRCSVVRHVHVHLRPTWQGMDVRGLRPGRFRCVPAGASQSAWLLLPARPLSAACASPAERLPDVCWPSAAMWLGVCCGVAVPPPLSAGRRALAAAVVAGEQVA